MNDQLRLEREEKFHDEWATSVMEALPNPIHTNEAFTSPELRFIHGELGELRGKSVLDLGCGLGEVSVYFALRGANVCAVDLSPQMLQATQKLAGKYGVTLETKKASSESINLDSDRLFDVIYVGNLFHHVDISMTMDTLTKHIKPDGLLVSWDPLAYNPLINVYRAIATEVRTEDEHPLRAEDVRTITGRFNSARVECFWLSTLVIFVLMALTRNPNKVRFWKAVVDECDKWAWLYRPLSAFDRVLLKIFPPLKWLCWNVVLICRGPKGV